MPDQPPSPDQPLTTPLSEASPTSFDELFSRDPLGLSNQDISLIVAKLRKDRSLWLLAEAKGAKRAPKAKPGEAADITLGALDL